jgi:hypothetical protein
MGCGVFLMTPHSVRRPDGYCLNELARAVARKLIIIPVMVAESEPPLLICRIQWLDMRDCTPLADREEQYARKFGRLVAALENDQLDFEGAQSRLLQRLEPLPFEADIAQHLSRFVGRQWVFEAIDMWMADPNASRIFWITGKPGVGKTAIAAWLCYHRREVAAFHLCRYGDKRKSDPRRCVLSIAYQLSSQLPDYQARLNALNLEGIVSELDPQTLFASLVVEPLSGNFPKPDHTMVALIDGLDEATQGSQNELATFIASEFARTPEWLRLIITSRPEPEVLHTLQGLTPYEIQASAPENERDIRAYLLRELMPYVPNGEVPPTTIDTVLKRSEGIFLYVEWSRQELALRRLSLDRLDEFPQGLGGVYGKFFRRQFPDVDAYESKLRPALEVVCAAQEPLAIRMLAFLFQWDEYEQRKFRRSLGSLFPVTEGYLQPFHQSVIDWLTDVDRGGPYFVSTRQGHQRLAEYGWQEYQRDVTTISSYTLAHLPSHLCQAQQRENLERLLTDLAFLEEKADVRMPSRSRRFCLLCGFLPGRESDCLRLRRGHCADLGRCQPGQSCTASWTYGHHRSRCFFG